MTNNKTSRIPIPSEDLRRLTSENIDPISFMKFCMRSESIRNLYSEIAEKYKIVKVK